MFRYLVLALLLLAAVPAQAVDLREIDWSTLLPPQKPIKNPLLELDDETRFDVGAVLSYRVDLRMGFIDEGDEDHKKMLEMEASLKAKNVDPDAMMAAIDDMQAEANRRGFETVAALDGLTVRIPGYALPLEFSETGVTEFLLVPYVGACIHTPPPPPNQIVYVKLNQTYHTENLYDAVWITGKIRIEPTSQALTYVDGTSEIATGYTITALSVEPYE